MHALICNPHFGELFPLQAVPARILLSFTIPCSWITCQSEHYGRSCGVFLPGTVHIAQIASPQKEMSPDSMPLLWFHTMLHFHSICAASPQLGKMEPRVKAVLQ